MNLTKTINSKTVIISAALCAIMGIAGTMAYFTDNDNAANEITIGNVSIDLTEPLWDAATDTDKDGIPDYAEDIVPTQSIQKDPMVTNTGKNSAYVIMKVSIPKASIYIADDNGTLPNGPNKTTQELFSYTLDTSGKWTLIGREESDSKVNSYIYGYNYVLDPGESTSKLFTSVKFCNAVEGQGLENSTQNINLEAYGIQSEGINRVQSAYSIYLNQKS